MAGPPAPPPSVANRTDRLVGGPRPGAVAPGQGQPNGLPVQVPTGLPYGEHQELSQAQHAVPGAAPPQPQAPQAPAGGPPGPAAPQQAPLDLGRAMQAAKAFQMPPTGALTRPTERPNEPVTAGLPGGPVNGATPQTGSLSSMLNALAQASSSAAISQLAARAQAAGQ